MKAVSLVERIDTSMSSHWGDIGLLTTMEQHLDILRKDQETIKVEVTPNEAEYYLGNFHGLLYSKNIPAYLHWVVTRLNGLDSSHDLKEMLDFFYVPNVERVNRIKEIYLTTHNI